uniref:Uncharacterized protein n=1 Tax=Ditylenchus dipsaci TaxID=166011 RepID=A0A915EVD0_9BILA
MYGAEEIVNWLHYTTEKDNKKLRKLTFEAHSHRPQQIYRAIEIAKEMFIAAKHRKFSYKFSFAFMHDPSNCWDARSWKSQAEGDQWNQMFNGFDLYNPVTKEKLILDVDMQHLYLNNSRKLERFEVL